MSAKFVKLVLTVMAGLFGLGLLYLSGVISSQAFSAFSSQPLAVALSREWAIILVGLLLPFVAFGVAGFLFIGTYQAYLHPREQAVFVFTKHAWVLGFTGFSATALFSFVSAVSFILAGNGFELGFFLPFLLSALGTSLALYFYRQLRVHPIGGHWVVHFNGDFEFVRDKQ